MKKLWIGTSWKMNKSKAEAQAWTLATREAIESSPESVQPFVIPPFPYVDQVSQAFAESKAVVGAQNMCWQDAGAFTGEVSPLHLKDCGATLVELGHSERRAQFGETDETVNKKVLAALKHGLTPLVCVGDTHQEKAWGVSIESVVRQVKIALHQVPSAEVSDVIIAYEPVWAIGEHGTPATSAEAASVHDALRVALTDSFGEDIAQRTVLLYGGSVNLENANELLSQTNIDGLFVGRTAWNAEGYCHLLEIARAHS